MQDLCPLCLKNGVKNKIKLLQISFQEAVWVCEEEKCVWPFGYEDFTLYPRVVGKIWSCYWEDYKSSLPKVKDNVTISIQPQLCGTNLPTITTNEGTHYSINIENNCNSLNKQKVEFESNEICANTLVEPKILPIDDKKECTVYDSSLSKNNICSENNMNSCLLQFGSNTKNLRFENQGSNVSTENVKQNYALIENTKSISRGIPKIKSIEKTNIDISNVKIGNQISLYRDLNKNSICFNKTIDNTETTLPSISEKSLHFNTIEKKKSTLNSNLKVTQVEIKGLSPITLTFNTPVHTANSETVTSMIQLSENKPTTKPNASEIKNVPIKRNVTGGKQYEKFSFSALKKKVGTSNSINTNDYNGHASVEISRKVKIVEKDSKNITKEKDCNKSINSPHTTGLSNNHKQTIRDLSSTCTVNELDNCLTNISGQTNIPPDTLVTNNSMSLDTVLEDLLTNDYNVSEDLNDEWLNSLLS